MEAGYWELKRFERRSQDGGKQRYAGGDITKESEEMQIEALKEAYEELKEMYGEENIIAVIHETRQRPICIVILVPLDRWGIGEGRDRRQKKMRRTQEKFLEARKKGCRQISARLEPESITQRA